MPALRRSGGPGGRTQFQWQGATVARQVTAAVQTALANEASEIRADLQASLHKVTGRMAAESFAEVSVAGTKRTLRLGSDAPYSVFEEEGTSQRPGHHVIRTVADRHTPHITPAIRAAMGRG
jgi:hypothetical protein